MNKFEKQLEKWNKGILRGAQAKLAKILKVSTATTALWATGKRHPSKGYVERMAALFGLDTYEVLRLFEKNPSVIYPIPSSSQLQTLRERTNQEYLYSAGTTATDESSLFALGNTVSIPCLATIARNFPTYNAEQILEWWSIPLRYAQGAKYLVPSQALGLKDACADDLCLVRPDAEIQPGKVLIFSNSNGDYLVTRVKSVQKNPTYTTLSGKTIRVPKSFEPIAQIIKRIRPI